jgi:hypothetical protein
VLANLPVNGNAGITLEATMTGLFAITFGVVGLTFK